MKKNTQTILFIVVVVGLISCSIITPFAILIISQITDYQKEKAFLAIGKRGKAKVLKVADKSRHTAKGTTPRAKLLLEVSVPNYPTYQVETTKDIPVIHAPRVQPGLTIDVLVDPDQPDNEDRIALLLNE